MELLPRDPGPGREDAGRKRRAPERPALLMRLAEIAGMDEGVFAKKAASWFGRSVRLRGDLPEVIGAILEKLKAGEIEPGDELRDHVKVIENRLKGLDLENEGVAQAVGKIGELSQVLHSRAGEVILLSWNQDTWSKTYDDFVVPAGAVNLFEFKGMLEAMYRDLPFPDKTKVATLYTMVKGGQGDLAAGVKAIRFLQRLKPTLQIDWVIDKEETSLKDARIQRIIDDAHLSNVTLISPYDKPLRDTNLIITGPVLPGWGTDYLTGRVLRGGHLDGPRFDFDENGKKSERLHDFCRLLNHVSFTKEKSYTDLFDHLFTSIGDNQASLPMGLRKGTGIFLDQKRLQAPLPRGDCDPDSLLKIEDESLRKDILQSCGLSERDKAPDYDRYSINSGYAYHDYSLAQFIDFVAIHETSKDVVVILTHRDCCSDVPFLEKVLTPQKLQALEQMGYHEIVLKAENDKVVTLKTASSTSSQQRKLHVIIRPYIASNDMMQLQLASERLLSTGDNSCAEALASRCKLFYYELVYSSFFGISHKEDFHKQLVEVAKSVDPLVAELLVLEAKKGALDEEEMRRAVAILRNPILAAKTLQFCQTVIDNYSFEPLLEASLKRALWHDCIPELAAIEAKSMEPEFQSEFQKLIRGETPSAKAIPIANLGQMRHKILQRIHEQQ